MVTWNALGFGLLAFLALAGIAAGVMTMFAGGMSDAPADGAAMGKKGCIGTIIALVIFVVAVIMLVRGHA